MTEIEKKALALVNEVRDGRGYYPLLESFSRNSAETEALCRAIEQHEADKAAHAATVEGILNSHEAYKQEVSDAAEYLCRFYGVEIVKAQLERFVLPTPIDPLVDAFASIGALDPKRAADNLHEALAKRGLKIVEDV